jgi:hypothetical protein
VKPILALVLLSLMASSAFAGQVRGYIKKDGTYVAPHHRSSPNSTKFDNYQTEGNYNPNTGKLGTKPAWPK